MLLCAGCWLQTHLHLCPWPQQPPGTPAGVTGVPPSPRLSLPALSQLVMLQQTLRSFSRLHTAPAAPLPSLYPSPRCIHQLPVSIPSLYPSQPPAKAPSAASAEPCTPLPQRRLPALPSPLRLYFSCLSCQLCSPNASTHRHCWHPLRLPWDVPVPCKASCFPSSLLLHAAAKGAGWGGEASSCPEGDRSWHLGHAGSIPAGELLSHPKPNQSTSGKPCLVLGCALAGRVPRVTAAQRKSQHRSCSRSVAAPPPLPAVPVLGCVTSRKRCSLSRARCLMGLGTEVKLCLPAPRPAGFH